MTEEQALKIAFGWFEDVTDGRPSDSEHEAAKVIKRMYQQRKKDRLADEAETEGSAA